MTVGVGIVGTGFGASVHVPAFRALQNVSIVGITSRSPARAADAARRLSIRPFTSWQELVNCSQITAISIAAPPSTHAAIATAAAAAGKAVLCEKPLARNAAEAEAMLRAVTIAQVVNAVDFEFREVPSFRLLRQMIESGELGSIRFVTIEWIVASWGDRSRPWTWRSGRAEGGGALGALAVHAFDYIEWLFGTIHSIAANLQTLIRQRPGPDDGHLQPVDAEDFCDLMMEVGSGIPIHAVITQVARTARGHAITVYGDRKTLLLENRETNDYIRGFMLREADPGEDFRVRAVPRELEFQHEFEDGRIAPFAALASRFIEAIEQSRTAMTPSFAEGLRTRRVMDAAIASSEARSWLTVPANT